MKKKAIGAVLLTGMFLISACHKGFKWADPELHEKYLEVTAKYRPLLIGDWSRIEETDTRKAYYHIRFNKDGTMASEEKVIKRDTVYVEGNPTLSEWKSAWENKVRGTWSITVLRNESTNQFEKFLYFSDGNMYLFEELEGDSLNLIGYPTYLFRGDLAPDF